MGVIGLMNFASVDLNLLRVFDAMMLELNTGRAGERVGLSQPAVSAALGRLRHITGDALFVRDGNRMVPTPRAESLATPVREALSRIELALAETSAFDPAALDRTLRIIGSDYFSTLLMPALAARLRTAAPGLSLQMLDRPTRSIAALLSDGAADFALDSRTDIPDWIEAETVLVSGFLTAVPAGDPRLAEAGLRPGERIPPELFCALPHVMMSMDGGVSGPIDQTLEEAGLTRRVVLTVPHFHAVALAVREAGLVGSIPEHFARRVAPLFGLDLYRPPFDPDRVDVMLYWHRRHARDPARSWMRDRLVETVRTTIGDGLAG